MNNVSDSDNAARISRRSFLKASAAAGGAAAVLGKAAMPVLGQEVGDAETVADAYADLPPVQSETDSMASRASYTSARDFAILPWDSWRPLSNNDRAQADSIRECGFNLAFTDLSGLRAATRAGLQVILREDEAYAPAHPWYTEDEINRAVRRLVRRVDRATDGKGVFGYDLDDEPKPDELSRLKPWVKAFRREAPDALVYINLGPGVWYPFASEADYINYLEDYVSILEPEFISYDFYALWESGSIRPEYFWNLEVISRFAKQHGLPFWNTVLSNGHHWYSEPTEAWLRFQMNTTLAYGAGGISWFTYKTPDGGNFRLAPIDEFGRKTPTWDMLSRVNGHMQNMLPVYLTLEHLNVFHYPEVPYGASGIETSVWMAAHADSIELEPSVNICVGEFSGPYEEKYIMVVNTDLYKSTRFRVEPFPYVYWVNSYTGEFRQTTLSGDAAHMAPGQGMLFMVL